MVIEFRVHRNVYTLKWTLYLRSLLFTYLKSTPLTYELLEKFKGGGVSIIFSFKCIFCTGLAKFRYDGFLRKSYKHKFYLEKKCVRTARVET